MNPPDRAPGYPAAIFLSAEWRSLAMLNYAVDPAVLRACVPAGTELDEFGGRTFVSMVAFLFQQTRVFGFRFPFHTNFAEVNLRFYVRRHVPNEDKPRRGTVFIKEIVPRRIIATMARWLYNEPYITCPMRHRVGPIAGGMEAEYRWKYANRWQTLGVKVDSAGPSEIAAGSEEEFITEHYWGYNRQRSGETLEYQVEHPRWRVQRAREHRFDCDVSALYGGRFAPFLSVEPSSAFLVEGSAVKVRKGQPLEPVLNEPGNGPEEPPCAFC